MGAPKKFDWFKAKDLYCQGLTAAEVAEAIGASALTVRKMANKEGWAKSRALTKEGARMIEPSHITAWLNHRMSGWMQTITRYLECVSDAALRMGSAKTRQDLKTDAAILRDLVTAGRATFGLDKAQAEQPKLFAASIRVGVTVDGGPAMEHGQHASAVIDVDSQQHPTLCDETAKQMVLTEAGQVTDPLPEPAIGADEGGKPFEPRCNDIPPTQ
jgi:hypothetical protein